jgi:hypothetical protein
MNNIDRRYNVREVPDAQILAYIFFSEGQNEKEDVLKIIQYTYVQDFESKPVYNLGFGDFDIENGHISDETLTDNGDVYKIFNTVLSTIPKFYTKHPQALILVQGSDGREEFESRCRLSCTRHCRIFCHNFNRRMRIYCAYVSRKFDIFKPYNQFFGGFWNNSNWFDFEEFIPGKIYDAIIVFQKNA